MSLVRSMVIGMVMLGCAGFASADEKISPDKLVGSWKVVKSEDAPEGAMVEFIKGGKLKVSAMIGDQTLSFDGTYKLEGEKLTITIELGKDNKENIVTIKKLTDTEMVTLNDKGKMDEFSKAKK